MLQAILDYRVLGASSISGVGAAALAGEAVWGALAAAGILVGNVTGKVVDTKLNLDEVKRGPGSEVAFVHEIMKL